MIVNSVIYFIILGNDAIHQLATGRNSSLRFTITPMNGSVASFKIYHQFYIFDEDQNYRLQLANPGNGNLGTSNSNIFSCSISFTDINELLRVYLLRKYQSNTHLKNLIYILFRAMINLYMNIENYCLDNFYKLLYN